MPTRKEAHRPMKTRLIRVAAITLGCCMAIFLASVLGLVNSVSAGIITILGYQNTKKETLRSAMERLLSFAIALAIALVSFSLLGYSLPAFGVYLFLFALILYALGWQASLPICTVLISHFLLAGHMQPWLTYNQALIMVIGTGIAILLNLLTPRDIQTIRARQRYIEDILRAYLMHLSAALSPTTDRAGTQAQLQADAARLSQAIEDAQVQARTLTGDSLLSDTTYFTRYLDMRRNQADILSRICIACADLSYLPQQAEALSAMLWEIAKALHEGNDAIALLVRLEAMRDRYRKDPLPVSRDEFESRATLYRILMDTGYFLLLKQSFVESLTPEQRATYLGKQ